MQPVTQPVEPVETDRVTMVVGVDFTEASDYAIRLAANLARPSGLRNEIHLVHVTRPLYWPVVHGIDAPAFVASDSSDVTRRRLLDSCLSAGCKVDSSVIPHVRVGDATEEIAELAREVHADLIVIGAHKRKGLARALHRSTYARIVRSAPARS
jgi:nucleotide-binding universal stress UspA family protein